MDLGCSKHVTSHIANYIEYTPFDSPGKAEIADKKELDILGVGTIAIRHEMMDGKISNIMLLQVLFVPTANRHFYSLCIATEKGCEAHQTRECHDVYSLDGMKFITGTCKATSGLFFFKAKILRKQDSEATISVLKLNTHDLWHQHLGHANLRVIKALPAHIIGGPATGAASPPTGLCDGCEKGKFKRLPFPPSKSQAKTTLALVHSDLDEMSTASINGYKWTATYLDNHTRYGMMFFLKHKDEQFDAFKTYKAWAEHQTGQKLITICTDRGGEFLSKEQKRYLQECGIEHQTSMPYSPQQNGRAECFQQTIINKAESMQHAAGLSDGFWKHAVGTAVHVYNVTPISKAEFLTLKEMWSGSKLDISHLRIFRCVAYLHVLKGKRRKLDLKSQEMIFVGYENLSKGWQFWDAKNQCIKISCDVKFNESWFPLRKDLDQRNPSAVELPPGQFLRVKDRNPPTTHATS